MQNFIKYFDDIFEHNSWLRTFSITIGISSGVLFSIKFILSSRRGICKNNVSLSGKTCVVTGGNTGIGKAVAYELAKRDARVILACRDMQKGNAAAAEIRAEVGNPDVDVYQLDLASFSSIRHCAEAIKESEKGIDILVNNAGLMSCPFQKSEDGLEMQFAVNHLGHFLLTNLLVDEMKGKADARIIIVSSSLYKYANIDLVNFNDEKSYNPSLAYGRSKLANILFARQLSQKLPEGITVNAMHPGIVWTELGRYRLINPILKVLFSIPAYFLMRSPTEGAQTIIHMATDPHLKGESGKYFGDCKMESVKPNAEDDQVAASLWEVSEALTGFKWMND